MNNDQHQEMLNEFIALANRYKDEGAEPQLIAAAMMSATAVYTTYVHAGNDGYLQESGVEKVTNVFTKHLNQIQDYKRMQVQQNQQSG